MEIQESQELQELPQNIVKYSASDQQSEGCGFEAY